MLSCTLVVQVRRHNLPVAGRPGAVGGGDGRRAWLAVPGNLPPLRGAGHRDGVDGGGVAVTVAVVLVPTSVATRPHEDGALAVPAPVNPLQDRQSTLTTSLDLLTCWNALLANFPGPSTLVEKMFQVKNILLIINIHRLAVIIWPPGRGVDVDVVRIERQRLGLHGV